MMMVVELVGVVVVGVLKKMSGISRAFFFTQADWKKNTSQNIEHVIRYQAIKACYIE